MSAPIEIQVSVKNQKLKLETNIKSLVRGAHETVYFKFDFAKEWHNLTIFANFRQDEQDCIRIVNEESKVEFPGGLHEGYCLLSLYGEGIEDNELKIATTNALSIRIEEHEGEGWSIGNITPSVEEASALGQLIQDEQDTLDYLKSRINEPKSNNLDFDYLATEIRRYSATAGSDLATIDPLSRYTYQQNNSNITQGTPSEPQAIVHIGHDADDNDIVLAFYAPSYETYDGWGLRGEKVLVKEFKFTPDHQSSEKLREQYIGGSDTADVGHVNAGGYNSTDNLVYLAYCGCYDSNGGTYVRQYPNASNAIQKFTYNPYDPDNRTDPILTNQVQVSLNSSAWENSSGNATDVGVLSYNKESGVALEEGLYTFTTTVCKVGSNGEKIEVFKPSEVLGGDYIYTKALEGLAVKGDYVYITTHKPNAILVFDCSGITDLTANAETRNGQVKLVKIYNIPFADEYGHLMRFPEDIDYCVDTGDFFINIWTGLNKVYYGGRSQLRACYVYKFNPFTNVFSAVRSGEAGVQASTDATYVKNYTVNEPPIYQKGTEAWPFTTLAEGFYATAQCKDDRILRIRPETTSGTTTTWNEHIKIWGGQITVIPQKYDANEAKWKDNGDELIFNSLELLDGNYRFLNPLTLAGGENNNGETLRIFNSLVDIDGERLKVGRPKFPYDREVDEETINGTPAIRCSGSTLNIRYAVDGYVPSGTTPFGDDDYILKAINSTINAAFDKDNFSKGIILNHRSVFLRQNYAKKGTLVTTTENNETTTTFTSPKILIEDWGNGFLALDRTPEPTYIPALNMSTTLEVSGENRGTFDYLPKIRFNINSHSFTGFISVFFRVQYDFSELDEEAGNAFDVQTPARRITIGKNSSSLIRFRYPIWFGSIEFDFTPDLSKGTFIARYFDDTEVDYNDIRIQIKGIKLS